MDGGFGVFFFALCKSDGVVPTEHFLAILTSRNIFDIFRTSLH